MSETHKTSGLVNVGVFGTRGCQNKWLGGNILEAKISIPEVTVWLPVNWGICEYVCVCVYMCLQAFAGKQPALSSPLSYSVEQQQEEVQC